MKRTPKTHSIHLGGEIRPQGNLETRVIRKGPKDPPTWNWRKTLADWVAKPLVGQLVRDLAGWVKDLLFGTRRRHPRAGAST